MGCRTLQLLALALFVVLCTSRLGARTWTTKDGNFTIEADFVVLKDEKVILKKENGKIVKVLLNLLSDTDQRVVKAMMAARKPKRPSQKLATSTPITKTGIRKYKAATVLVDLGERGSGSGFCIRSDGLFITNRHVVEGKAVGEKVTLVLNATEANEKVIKARIVAVSKKYDLALLKASRVSRLPYLKLGKDNDLIETMSVLALGFPFGKMLAVNEEGYPSISLNTGKISAVRKKKGVIESIQVDAKVNPGNSGGPVLDENGKVIGVIVSGIFGSGVSFAIPVSHVEKFLDQPTLILKEPTIQFADRHKPIPFEIEVLRFSKKKQTMDVEVTLTSGSSGPRTIRAKAKDSGFTFTAAPQEKSSKPLKLLVWEQEGGIRSSIDDKEIRVGNKPILLSQVRRVEYKDGKNILTTNYEKIYSGQVTGLGTFKGKQGKAVDLAKSKRVDIYTQDEKAGLVLYKIVAKQGDQIVSESAGIIEMAGAPLPASLAHPAKAVQFQGHWYMLYSENTHWSKAAAQCERLGGQLVCIETFAEAQFVARLAKGSRVYLGGFRNAQGKWMWVNKKPMIFRIWTSGEPNNYKGIENRLLLLPTGTWNDIPDIWQCDGYICEWGK